MKLYIRSEYTQPKIDELKPYFSEIVYEPWTKTGERYYEDEMLKKLQEIQPDAIVTELDRITEKVLTGYTKLKVIADCRATPANLEMDAITKRKIPVLCTRGRNSQAVAEMTVGMLLTFMRRIIPATQWIKDGKWVKGTTPYFTWMGNELYGKKVGLVGMGQIAKILADLLAAFKCEVSFYDPFVESYKNYKKVDLNTLFKENDIVSIHVPPMPSTANMIKKEHFDLMKKDAIFVNVARSMIVEQEPLYEVLKNHKIKGALIDVIDVEPPETEADRKIGLLDNVLLTPHICGATYEVALHQTDIINDEIIKWCKGVDLDKIIYNKGILK